MGKLADSINFLMKRDGLDQLRLSKVTGLAASSINNILTGKQENPTLNTLRAISDVFFVTVAQLIGEESLNPDTVNLSIPFYEMDTLVKKTGSNRTINFTLPAELSKNKTHFFATLVEGSSMEPKFPSGTILLIKEADKYVDGDYVIATINSGTRVVFKRLIDTGQSFYLVSTNPTYNTQIQLDLNAGDRILGKMILYMYSEI